MASDGSSCGATVNPVVCENRQPGTPQSVWDISGSGDSTIQGFATDISVNAGNTISFKVNTSARAYTIDIYRLGYYGGNGARKVASVTPSATLPQSQPACATDPATSLYDCGTWAVSASWSVPSSAVSGVYLADLTRTDTGGMSQITFVVRNDASTSDMIYQTSDETWQAYNRYGGSDFYTGNQQALFDSPTRARALSYNRPFITRGDSHGRDFLFSNEYPTIRFLERNGYDVSYLAGVDVDRSGATLLSHHKVFLSVGHDEYWSQRQRTNVTNARDAGVNLMFLSGNEVFWHTRFAASIDGSNTAYRTLICYKETWDNTASDPSGEHTGTWRDPRFGAAPGGSNPENSLTGTMYMANSTALPLTVTAAQGRTRIWRNTGLASMSGTSTDLAPNIVGYESDEDLDNGFRNAGQVDLSTTTGASPQESIDFGQNTAAGTTTHHITEYRAASGALVFGAGTIQWGWGLDAAHDGTAQAASVAMQQATVNLLADMGAQPQTLAAGLVAATASTDTTAPTSAITAPAAGAALANGTSLTVTGTASDTGGVVAGVEVSLDSGRTWHPATGTTSWSYTGIVHGNGPVTVLSRATDDSLNTESPGPGVGVNVGCPCSLFGQSVPRTVDSGDPSQTELGVRFVPATAGYVTGVRFYKSTANTGTHLGSLWTTSGTRLATGTFVNETASGWQTLTFDSPVLVSAGTTYVASYYAPNGHYSEDARYFYYRDLAAPPLSAPANSPTDATSFNAVYATSNSFPNKVYAGDNYYVDPVFTASAAGAPAVTSTTPTDGAASVDPATTITATFSTAVTASSISFTVRGPSAAVTGAVSYDATTRTATFTPTAALSTGTRFTASVSASSTTGAAMVVPTTWQFTTSGPATCPCTLFDPNAAPATADSRDSSAISVGVRFSSSVAGSISGVRFYKSTANTGTHTGSLWSAGGVRLATGTFSGETASGWQTLTFSSAVSVTAGTTYVVSYYAPSGHYAEDDGFFANPLTKDPLAAPASAGVYHYGGDVFPDQSYANANYWVDPIFSTAAGSAPATAPTVTATTPAAGATGVTTSVAPTATFSAAVTSSSVSFTVSSVQGAVAGSVSYDATSRTATFTPTSALTAGTQYSATVKATGTNAMPMTSPTTWSFTTAGTPTCPCTLLGTAVPKTVDGADGGAVSLGVKFAASTSGSVTGVRFYKATANTGTHTATLWSAAGTKLATATFTTESASGWQTVQFASPVAVTAGTTYVASYYAPVGHYAEDVHYFDAAVSNGPLSAPVGAGTYTYGSDTFPSSTYANANYWVDPIFVTGSAPASTPADTTPPTVSAVAATGSGTSATVTWSTNEASSSRVDYGTTASALTASATASGLVTSHSVTLTGLQRNTGYWFRVTSADAAGNSTVSPASSAAPATYTPTVTPMIDTTTGDFSAGTVSGGYVAANGDGEVVLAPSVVNEFAGSTVPSSMTSHATATGGGTTVANGSATVSGATLTTTATYGNGRSLEARATMGANQSLGWVTGSNTAVQMAFSVSAGQLLASVNDGGLNVASTIVASTWSAAPHTFRIEWTSTAATFYLDNTQVYSHAFTTSYSTTYRPQFADTDTVSPALSLDWFRLAPYAASGTFTSRVLDASTAVGWDALSWDAAVPSGTTMVVAVRTGNTATPDSTWSAYTTLTSGAAVNRTARYLQYQLAFTSTAPGFVSPALRSVSAAYHAVLS